MREVILKDGTICQVDDEDYERVMLKKWHRTGNGKKYAGSHANKTALVVYMHRFILNLTDKDAFCDHKDGNGFNNQKYNLRITTNSQNQMNAKVSKRNKLGVKGVYFYKGRYKTQIKINGVQKFLGCYDTLHEAANAYNKAALKYFKEYAKINII